MKKYFFLAFSFLFIVVVMVFGVYICPDFMFLQSYFPNVKSYDYICGAYVLSIGYLFFTSIILFFFVAWDFFKGKTSGKGPDKNKNENKE